MEKPKINLQQAFIWLQQQGIAIVVLIGINVGMFAYFTQEIDILQKRLIGTEVSVQILNDKLIECERSKYLDYLKSR